MDAEVERPGPELQRQPLGHGPAARLQHRGGDRGAQRLHGAGDPGGVQVGAGVAVGVGGGQGELDQLGFEGGGLVAPAIVLEGREGIGVRRDLGLGLRLQPRARRAVEEARIDVDPARLVGHDRSGGGPGDAHRQPLGREVLHLEAGGSGRVVRAVHLQRDLPHAARAGGGQHDVLRQGAVLRAVEADAAKLRPGRAPDHQGAAAVLHRVAQPVTHQRHQMHRLARAVDAPVGVEETVHRRRRAAPLGRTDARHGAARVALHLTRQVDRRAGQIEQGEVGLGSIGHHALRVGGAFAVEQGLVEADVPVGVARDRGQLLAVVGHQRHAHPRHRPRGLQ